MAARPFIESFNIDIVVVSPRRSAAAKIHGVGVSTYRNRQFCTIRLVPAHTVDSAKFDQFWTET
jgi:hypothetical protein